MLTGRLRSVRVALRGAGFMLQTQKNACIHAVATVTTVALGVVLGLSAPEWCWIVLAIVAVWVAEALNTAIEMVTDIASPSFHPLAGRAKDVAAAGVLIAVAGAITVGLLVFGPRLYALLARGAA